jgi:hypothetical protein
VLAQRYSWSRTHILEDLYWEELAEHVKYAANAIAQEENADRKFQFMLHADEKSRALWEDAQPPFPEEHDIEYTGDGVNQLPENLQSIVYKE